MYINTATLQYPLSERDIREALPNTSFANPFVAPDDYAWVFPAPAPDYNPVIQSAREIAPVLTVKGTWEQQWEVVDRYKTQEEADAAIAADIKSQVPTIVTMRQARLALLEAGLLDQIQQAITEPKDKIYWEYSPNVERDNYLVQQLGAAFKIDIDELFTKAAKL